jgi:arginine decarboxylase
VHVKVDDEGGWWIEEFVEGDTAADVLGYVQYDVRTLFPTLRRDCERAVRDGRLSVAESRALQEFYKSALGGYTYLER